MQKISLTRTQSKTDVIQQVVFKNQILKPREKRFLLFFQTEGLLPLKVFSHEELARITQSLQSELP